MKDVIVGAVALIAWDDASLARLMGSSRWKYETGNTSLATSDPKMFFVYVRRNRQRSRQIMTLKTDLWVIVKETEVQAGHCNELYNAVFRTDAEATYFNTVNSISEAYEERQCSKTLPSIP